jgi:hypothetical protein
MQALRQTSGPALRVWFQEGQDAGRETGVAALGQSEPGRAPWTVLDRAGMLAGLRAVQTRLERACLTASFLPMDPAAAVVPEAAVPGLLAASAPRLQNAIADAGKLHQWDVVLRWSAEAVVAANRAEIAAEAARPGEASEVCRAAMAQAVATALGRERTSREAALRAALAPAVMRMAELGNGPAQTGLTVLVPSSGEAAIETALQSLPDFASTLAEIDLRGPLPPVSFAAVRVTQAEPGDIARAWRLLRLPGNVDAAGLRAAWIAAANCVHPDHAGPEATGDAMAEVNGAYRLLCAALSGHADTASWSLRQLQRRAALHLATPAPLGERVA